MPVRKSSFGEIPESMLMIGVVVFIIVIGVLAYLYKKNKSKPSATTAGPVATTAGPVLPPYSLYGPGRGTANLLYASPANVLKDQGDPGISYFTEPTYLKWVNKTYNIVKLNYPTATHFSVWIDGGYRVYTGSVNVTPDNMTQTYKLT